MHREWQLAALFGVFIWIGYILNAIPVLLLVYMIVAIGDIAIFCIYIFTQNGVSNRYRALRDRSSRRLAQLIAIVVVVMAAQVARGQVEPSLDGALNLASQIISIWGVAHVVLEMSETLAKLGLPVPQALRQLLLEKLQERDDRNGKTNDDSQR